MLTLSKKWLEYLRTMPETGMGYQVVRIALKDGQFFEQALVDSGMITRIHGLTQIPFSEEDIAAISVTHQKWNWREES